MYTLGRTKLPYITG